MLHIIRVLNASVSLSQCAITSIVECIKNSTVLAVMYVYITYCLYDHGPIGFVKTISSFSSS